MLTKLVIYAAIAATTIGVLSIQNARVMNQQLAIEQLETELASRKEAAMLIEDLRIKNDLLTAQRDQLQEELKNAEEYDTPLSDVFRESVERMRDANPYRPSRTAN